MRGEARGPSRKQIMLGLGGHANDSKFCPEGNGRYYKILSRELT